MIDAWQTVRDNLPEAFLITAQEYWGGIRIPHRILAQNEQAAKGRKYKSLPTATTWTLTKSWMN